MGTKRQTFSMHNDNIKTMITIQYSRVNDAFVIPKKIKKNLKRKFLVGSFLSKSAFKKIGVLLAISIILYCPQLSYAQCSMCSINAEQGMKNGNTVSVGINTGVIYLLSTVYLLIIGISVLWYKKFRKKNVILNIKHKPINLN